MCYIPAIRVSLPPTIRSSTENPHTPGAGKSLARRATPESPVLCVAGDGVFGVWVTGGCASYGQQTCNSKFQNTS